MLIKLINKETLRLDDYILKCSIGKNGISSRKKEGDKCTPRGIFKLGKLYYRADRVKKPTTKISTKIIKKNMGWCDDVTSIYYNKEIKINSKIKPINDLSLCLTSSDDYREGGGGSPVHLIRDLSLLPCGESFSTRQGWGLR